MAWLEIAVGAASRVLTPTAGWLWNWLVRRNRPLKIRMERFEEQGVLRAFDFRATNVGSDPLCLRHIYLKQPKHAQLAIRWRPLAFFADEGPQYDPWEITTEYDLDYVIDPGETYDCEIGFPKGFAISESRRQPVIVAIDIQTFGEREQRVTQEIRRWIDPQ